MAPKRKAVTDITAMMVIREHGLTKWSVRDDGRCWLYAIMSQLGTYKPTPKRGNGRAKDPTDTELVSAQLICEKLVDDYNAEKILLKGPDYAGERDIKDFMATYGGPTEWQLIVQMFDLIVILWDPRRPKDMNDPDKKFYIIFRENDKGVIRDMIPRQIKEKIDTSPATTKAVHVAWSNTIDAHFDLYM